MAEMNRKQAEALLNLIDAQNWFALAFALSNQPGWGTTQISLAQNAVAKAKAKFLDAFPE